MGIEPAASVAGIDGIGITIKANTGGRMGSGQGRKTRQRRRRARRLYKTWPRERLQAHARSLAARLLAVNDASLSSGEPLLSPGVARMLGVVIHYV